MEIDISKQLHAYEVEYHVLQDEMLESGTLPDDSDRLDKLEKTNVQLKKQNMELLEKLQVSKRIATLLHYSLSSWEYNWDIYKMLGIKCVRIFIIVMLNH